MERLPGLERDFQSLTLNGVVTSVVPRTILGGSLVLPAEAACALGRDDLIPPHKLIKLVPQERVERSIPFRTLFFENSVYTSSTTAALVGLLRLALRFSR